MRIIYKKRDDSYLVRRGGYWNDYALLCRLAYRSYNSPSYHGYGIGFRPSKNVKEKK